MGHIEFDRPETMRAFAHIVCGGAKTQAQRARLEELVGEAALTLDDLSLIGSVLLKALERSVIGEGEYVKVVNWLHHQIMRRVKPSVRAKKLTGLAPGGVQRSIRC